MHACLTLILMVLPSSRAQIKNLYFHEFQTYAPPAEEDAPIQNPLVGTLDSKGWLYLLDEGAKLIFVWNHQGEYISSLGGEGQGPGEFTFADPARSKVVFDGQNVLVLDDRAHRLHAFRGMKLHHVRNTPTEMGRIADFKVLANGDYLLWLQAQRKGQLFSRVCITNSDFEIERTLLEYQDTMFGKDKNGNWRYFSPYSKKPVIACGFANQKIYIGDGISAEIQVFDMAGNLLQKLKVPLKPELITEEDKSEIRSAYKWIKTRNIKIRWPKHKNLYDSIFSVEKGLLVVAHYQVSQGRYLGVALNARGEYAAKFDQKFGEQGGLLALSGKTIAVYSDLHGDFCIKRVMPKLHPQHTSK